MKHCKTCKYWQKIDSEVSDIGTCKAVAQFWDATQWSGDFDKRIVKPEYTEYLAFVQDGSDYRAELITRSSFGCVQYKPS